MKIFISFLVLIGAIGCSLSSKVPNSKVILADNILYIDLLVNSKNARFIIDTGAGVSLIDRRQAQDYQIKVHDGSYGIIRGLGGIDTLYLASGAKVSDGNHILKGIKFYAADLGHLNDHFCQHGTRILGILGADYLLKKGAIIDFKNRQIQFSE